MSDKVYLGQRVSHLDTGEPSAKISRVNLLVDSEHMYTAGDDSGRTIEKTVPWGSQEMADTILSALRGADYRPYSGQEGLLDPAAEVGDGITVGGVYSVLAQTDILFDALCTADVSAPGGDEAEDEYPYKSSARRQMDRALAQVRSSIRKTASEITLLVEDTAKGISAQFSVELEKISSTVTGLDGKVSSIEQYAKSIRLSVTNGETSSSFELTAGKTTLSSGSIKFTGFVTFEGLSKGTTEIDGGCIKTGTISAERIDTDNIHVKKVYGSNNKVCVGEKDSNTLCVGGNTSWDYDTLRLYAHNKITLSSYTGESDGVTLNVGGTRHSITGSTLWSLGTSSDPWGAIHTGTHTIYSGATAGMTITSYQIYSTKESYLGTSTYPWNHAYITELYLNGTKLDTSKFLTDQSLADYAKTKDIYRLYSDSTHYLSYNTSRQLVPSHTGSTYGSYIGTSTSPFYGGYFTNLTVQGGTLSLGTSAAKLSFFGAAAQSRKSVASVSTSGTLANVITTLNNLITALKNYGLIS